MTYGQLLQKENITVLITGDSLSYNRYGFDPKPRHNAYNCGVGLPSWPFALRNRIYALDPQFLPGEALSVDCRAVSGLDNDAEVPFTAVFDGRIKTLLPGHEASFTAPVRGGQLVVYLQRRLENSCVFDVYVDGALAASDVDTAGSEDEFAGFGLMTLVLPCKEADSHTVTFRNIRGAAPKITLAAVGSRNINVVLTGRGSECTDYFVEHFEERIGQYRPDLLIITLGANDRANRTLQAMQEAQVQLYAKVFACAPDCQILHLLPPSSHNPADPDSDVTPYCSLTRGETYDRAMEQVANDLKARQYPIETMRMQDVFAKLPVSRWRFDNIHLNPEGNRLVLEAVCGKLGIGAGEERI